MISRNFIKSSLIYTMAGSLPLASSFVLLWFYNNYLRIDVFGASSNYLAFSLLVQTIITYSLDIAVYVYYAEMKNKPREYGALVTSSFLFIGVAGALFLLLFMFAGNWVFGWLYSNAAIQFFPYGLIAIVTALFQAFFKVYNSTLQIRQQPERFFWSNVVSFSLILGLSIAGLELFPNTLVGPIGGRMIAAIVAGAWAIYRVWREFGFHIDIAILRSTFGYNNGSYIYQLQQWVIVNFDKFLITAWLGLTDMGVYDFAFKCMLIIDFVSGSLYNTISPKVFLLVSDQTDKHSTPEINRYYHGMIGITMVLVSAALIFSPWIFQLSFIKPGYRDAIQYIPLLSLVYLVKGVRYYFSFPYAALRYSKPLPVIYLIISIVKIGLMLLFVPRFGVTAVIVSGIISSIADVVLLRLFIEKRFKFTFNKFKIIIAPASLALLIIAVGFVNLKSIAVSLIYLFFCSSILWWTYRKELKLIKPLNLFG